MKFTKKDELKTVFVFFTEKKEKKEREMIAKRRKKGKRVDEEQD